MFCAEGEVYTLIRDSISDIELAPIIFVMKREPVKTNPYQYDAVFAIQTKEGNEELLRKLMFLDENIRFAGSEVDAQSQGTILDFLFFSVRITQRKGK